MAFLLGCKESIQEKFGLWKSAYCDNEKVQTHMAKQIRAINTKKKALCTEDVFLILLYECFNEVQLKNT